MSELTALRTIVKAQSRSAASYDEVLAKAARKGEAKAAERAPPDPANLVTTATGRSIDISRGYNVRGPDGVKIPFNRNTPIEKAQEWTKNFYKPGEVELKPGRVGLKGDDKSYIDFQEQADGTRRIVMSTTSKKGTGVGAGMYKALFDDATKKGIKVQSDTAMSQASVDVWLRFKDMGYPVTVNPRKKMMSGGYENAKDPTQPLFEFVPAQAKKPEPVKTKPHLEAGGDVPKAGAFDTELRTALRGQNLPFEQRTEITKAYAKYQIEEDPEIKAALESEIRTMLPKAK